MEVDQCVYNVLGHPNCLGRNHHVQGTSYCKNLDCNPDINPTVESVIKRAKVAHFTGSCNPYRPWSVCKSKWKAGGNQLCSHFTTRWAQIAREALDKDPAVKKWAPRLEECVKNLGA